MSSSHPPRDAAQQIPVKVFSKRSAHAVESDGIDAAVREREAKAEDPEVMPESVIVLLGGRMDIKPQHKDMLGEEADGENYNERHHHFRHFFTSFHLLHLALHFPGYISSAAHQMPGH